MTIDTARAALRELGYPDGFEQTLVLIRPNMVVLGFHRAVSALVVANGFQIVRSERVSFDASLAYALYGEHTQRVYFRDLVGHMTSGVSKAYVFAGFDAAKRVHRLMGATDARTAKPGTIRHMLYGHFDLERPWANMAQASHDLPDAVREITLIFGKYPVLPRDDD